VKKVVFQQQINRFSCDYNVKLLSFSDLNPSKLHYLISCGCMVIPSKKAEEETCNEMIFIEFEIYRKILSHFHAQGLVVAKLIRSLKPRLCTV
jgi:hypothetical protein